MIRNFTTGKTKFVKYKVFTPNFRFPGCMQEGGIDLQTAIFQAKQYNKNFTIDIFDSYE